MGVVSTSSRHMVSAQKLIERVSSRSTDKRVAADVEEQIQCEEEHNQCAGNRAQECEHEGWRDDGGAVGERHLPGGQDWADQLVPLGDGPAVRCRGGAVS